MIWFYFKNRLSKHDNNFENTKLKHLSGFVIPDILMNILSCHGISKYSISTGILTCCSALVIYYLSKLFIILETEEGALDNIVMSVKKHNMQSGNPVYCLHIRIYIQFQDICMKFIYLTFMMTAMLNFITWSFVLNRLLTNWNILTSSLSGKLMWTKLIIMNSHKKKTHKPSGEK